MSASPSPKDLVKAALSEDLSGIGDITSNAIISKEAQITATMRAREDGILAGIEIAMLTFRGIDPNLTLTPKMKDGDALKTGQDILTIKGNTRHILMAERVALNFLSHLSGIASETAKYITAIDDTTAQIFDTRKTLPLMRDLQKHAVKMGGGENHRCGLFDAILIKDNHIAAAGGIQKALNLTREKHPTIQIEIEVDTLKQLQEVLDHSGANIVLLDNMPVEQLKQAVEMVGNNEIITEASGGVNLNTVRAIAQSGVNRISIGALTHSVTALDIGLDIKGQ